MPKLLQCFHDLGIRCNSKASYLPRQSLEKLNNSDPDHGSYKLTLTSNEDLVGHTKPVVGAYDILAHNGKLPNNLPDVLPLGAKLQPQPASPTSNNASPLRYSSSSNISTATTNSSSSPTHQHPTSANSNGTGYPPLYPTQHRYSTPAMNYYNHSNNQAPSYTRSQSYDVNTRNSNTSPTKFMSQSTIDLKKTHNLETTLEEAPTAETSKLLLSPAQSENNLSSSVSSNKHSVSTTKPQSPFAARREFHRATDMGGRTMSLDERSVNEEGRIVRAELVNTTLPNSPNTGAHKTITRKDSLRENIEKITQLQSKLMSAHLSAENTGLLASFSNKTSTAVAVPSQVTKTETETAPQMTTTQSDNDTVADKPKLDIVESITDPTTPPMLPKTPPPYLDSSTTLETATMSASDPTSHILQMDATTDGLKLMQRSELILRVNPLTVETASQTDDLPDSDMGRLNAENHQQYNKEDSQTRTTLQPRQRHPIEFDCDTMSKELAELLAPNDKLIELLTPHIIKSPSDYVNNLYNPNVPLRPTKRDVGTSTLMRMKTRDNQVEQATEKPGIITVELQYAEIEVSLTNGSGPDSCDMLKKKVDELIRQLNRKLKTLNKEQTTIGEESAINDELGNSLVTKLSAKVRPIEATKFRTYIDDIGHITSLLLSLSERLAKSENMLSTIEENDGEKKLLESKRDRLMEQLEEAKRLKEDIDRRGTSVSSMLERNLTTDEFADFDYFINMKAKLIADARDIADKIKCSEEQLCALSEALIQSDC